MSLKTVFQNFANDLNKTMHSTESLFDLITAYLPKFEESAGINYSDNERIVGTYYGSTLYEKDFVVDLQKGDNALMTDFNGVLRHYDLSYIGRTNNVSRLINGLTEYIYRSDSGRLVCNLTYADSLPTTATKAFIQIYYTK